MPKGRWRVCGRLPGRRGRIARRTMVALACVGVLTALAAAAILGRLSGGGRAGPAAQLPARSAVERLTIELATPVEPGAALAEPPLKETLATIGAAAGANARLFDDPQSVAAWKARSVWGDQRKAAQAAESSAQRNWEIRFLKGTTREQYTKQLDFFKIELAVVMPENQLVYAWNFGKATPDRRTGAADEEKRFYLTWREGDLGRAESDLLAKAGLTPGNRVVLTVLPPDVEAKLAQLEAKEAGESAHSVRKTRFGIRAEADGLAFYVIEQFRKE